MGMKYRIVVKPHASKDEVIKQDGQLIVKTKSKPIDGEANRAVIRLLSEYFDVPKSQIMIKSGAGSRHKVIEI